MSNINFKRTYSLGDDFKAIQARAARYLKKFIDDPDLFRFNNTDQSLTFTSERLVPVVSTNKPRIMLLFSNPHPHSVQQGMYLSPNTQGRENLFWPIMESAKWLPIKKEERTPIENLRDICLKADYEGPFEFIFYCYYAFPTDYPEDIRKIFGKDYFNQHIEPKAKVEFKETIQNTSTQAVLTFNKGIYNLVSQDPVARYIDRLKAGELVQSRIKGVDRPIPIYLTYPTGWHYHKDYKKLRKASLEQIKAAIFQ